MTPADVDVERRDLRVEGKGRKVRMLSRHARRPGVLTIGPPAAKGNADKTGRLAGAVVIQDGKADGCCYPGRPLRASLRTKRPIDNSDERDSIQDRSAHQRT